jgi:RHS repeat-associated protein
LFFSRTDHLNTPRQVYDDQQQLRWKWDQAEPFGVNTPNENPSSLGAFEMPLRFPGQFADRETNLFYNYFREYDSATGRYVESDPIGLFGGLNTYLYGEGIPTSIFDPRGLMGRGSGANGMYGPSRFMPPQGSPWFDYRYCGPGNLPGQPISCVDQSCKAHDECYSSCETRTGLRWAPHLFSGCAFSCDRVFFFDLIDCGVAACGRK